MASPSPSLFDFEALDAADAARAALARIGGTHGPAREDTAAAVAAAGASDGTGASKVAGHAELLIVLTFDDGAVVPSPRAPTRSGRRLRSPDPGRLVGPAP